MDSSTEFGPVRATQETSISAARLRAQRVAGSFEGVPTTIPAQEKAPGVPGELPERDPSAFKRLPEQGPVIVD
ncbi:hypothetical protein [Microbacterium testaceum]|uniref:hypothetical protein n=1 Tax=Microbacterium testaceum TaxID=2033 RepID=UPI002AC4E27A|nr:hypothetical protein [Microbacterium testaceum]MDZ5145102.1 hypothetical protein [Microbacterium testaceum]